MANRAGAEEVEQEADAFDRHLGLRLFGAGAQVRSTHHARHAEQRMFRAGLGGEHIERHAGDHAAFEPLDERLFVVDAAASAR